MPTKQLLCSFLAGIFIWNVQCVHCQFLSKQAPRPDLNEWWGRPDLMNVDSSIRPFAIEFSDELIADLRNRLATHRPFARTIAHGFEYGFNTAYLPAILDYWQNNYDFKSRENFLNQFPQYKTNIQGLDIHFIRVYPNVAPGTNVVPLLLLHGWPGSVREFYEVIPLLTTPRPGVNFVFDVIVPSLPGFGFSDPASRPGLGATKISVIMRNLMHRLGHERYYIQGGDWGSMITANMATLFPDEVLGYHTNMGSVITICNLLLQTLGSLNPLSPEMMSLPEQLVMLLYETGFFHLHATRPDSVGVALTDSPAGLAAYILEKFSTLTNPAYINLPDGGLTNKFTPDQLIDNLMIYWASNSIGTSIRIYYEELSPVNRQLGYGSVKTPVPTWVMQARYEAGKQSPALLRQKYVNLLNTTVLNDGGHFIALEEPATLADDLYRAVTAFMNFRRD